MRKTPDKPKLIDILQNTWPLPLKAINRKCRNPEEIKEAWSANIWYPELDSRTGGKKGTGRENGEIQIRSGVELSNHVPVMVSWL